MANTGVSFEGVVSHLMALSRATPAKRICLQSFPERASLAACDGWKDGRYDLGGSRTRCGLMKFEPASGAARCLSC